MRWMRVLVIREDSIRALVGRRCRRVRVGRRWRLLLLRRSACGMHGFRQGKRTEKKPGVLLDIALFAVFSGCAKRGSVSGFKLGDFYRIAFVCGREQKPLLRGKRHGWSRMAGSVGVFQRLPIGSRESR